MNILVVYGFGQVDLKKPFFKAYISGIIGLIEKHSIDLVVCTGGFTGGNNLPSEASSLKNILQKYGYEGAIALEERAFSTYENTKYSAEKIKEEYPTVAKIITCTTNTHIYKAMYLGLHFYSHCFDLSLNENEIIRKIQEYFLKNRDHNRGGAVTIDFSPIVFEGIDAPFASPQSRKQIVASIVETSYVRNEDVHNEFVEWRKKEWGLK